MHHHEGNAKPVGTRSGNFFLKAGCLCQHYYSVSQKQKGISVSAEKSHFKTRHYAMPPTGGGEG